MTTAATGFLTAICEDPHDVGLRLIYADWLEDNGEEARAEFIRVQCQLTKTIPSPDNTILIYKDAPPPGSPCTYGEALRRRERELLQAHGEEWFRLDFGYTGIGWPYSWPVFRSGNSFSMRQAGGAELDCPLQHCKYRRGFVEKVETTCEMWLKHGPMIVRAQPITEVKLSIIEVEHIDCEPGFAGWRSSRYELFDHYHTTRDEAVVAVLCTALRWARGPHPKLGLKALLSLEE